MGGVGVGDGARDLLSLQLAVVERSTGRVDRGLQQRRR